MDIQITSATTTDVASIGQTRADVRHSLGVYRNFRRAPSSEESDQFFESGVIATYSKAGLLVMLEFVDPAHVKIGGV